MGRTEVGGERVARPPAGALGAGCDPGTRSHDGGRAVGEYARRLHRRVPDEARVCLFALPGARQTPAVAQLLGAGSERRHAGDAAARSEEERHGAGQGGGADEHDRAASCQGAGEPNGGESVAVGRGELEGDELTGEAEHLGERLHVAALVVRRFRSREDQCVRRGRCALEQRQRRLRCERDGILVGVRLAEARQRELRVDQRGAVVGGGGHLADSRRAYQTTRLKFLPPRPAFLPRRTPRRGRRLPARQAAGERARRGAACRLRAACSAGSRRTCPSARSCSGAPTRRSSWPARVSPSSPTITSAPRRPDDASSSPRGRSCASSGCRSRSSPRSPGTRSAAAASSRSRATSG